jgi:dipeptidyl-peptidase-4
MKKTIVSLVAIIAALPLLAQSTISLEDCFVYYKYYPQSSTSYFYMDDGRHYAHLDKKGLHLRDLLDASKDSLVPVKIADAAQSFDQFEFSDDESKLLLRTATEAVYRHSVLANYFVYDFKTQKTSPVYEHEKQQFVSFAPDGLSVAFVAGNNIYIRDLVTDKLVQVTRDGQKNKIINGLADWVYEEEFSPVDGDGMVALRWSPDSKLLSYIRFDETEVPEFPITWYDGGAYPKRTSFKYPKVGEKNSRVSVHLYDTEADSPMGEVMGLEPDDYVPRIHFTYENRLVVSRLNRRQDTLELLLTLHNRPLYDQEEQKNYLPVRLLARETDAAYVELEWENKVTFLKNDPGHFLLFSDHSGFQHLWRYSMEPESAESPVALTQGNFDVTAFYGVNEKTGKFYFQAATPTPLDRQIWEGDLTAGKPARLLTPPRGTHEAQFNPTFEYMQHTWSDANTPPVIALCNNQDDTLKVLAKNERVRKLREENGFAPKEFFTFKTDDGTELNGWFIKPRSFDHTAKYPVLFDVYGGPGSQTVLNQYDGYMNTWHQLLAQKGYAIVSVDNRGTGARGRDFKKCTQLQLGKLETEDQIAAARYLRSLPWVDPARIGIWGWSFGGYLSTSCVLKGNDVFKMAIAVAPVTNWKWYDSVYTERYMETAASNGKGYEDNSPINFAERLHGDNYLICHGTADDNVHWQQTTEMINALIKANKQFETYYYPNRNHGIYGDNATIHLFTKLTDFILEKL